MLNRSQTATTKAISELESTLGITKAAVYNSVRQLEELDRPKPLTFNKRGWSRPVGDVDHQRTDSRNRRARAILCAGYTHHDAGAFFWKNKGFEEHARDIGLAEMPQVGVAALRH